MTVVGAALLGLMTGLHTATWGAYKDSPFEGFKWTSYLRSVVLGMGIAVGIAVTTTWTVDLHPVVVVGLVYTFERLATEWWKTIVRRDDQSAYTIPMRLGYRGLPVHNHAIRYTVGAAVIVGLILACAAATTMEHALPSEPRVGDDPHRRRRRVADRGRRRLEGRTHRRFQPVEVHAQPGDRHGMGGAAVVPDGRLGHPGALCGWILGGQHRDVQDLLHRRPPSREVRHQTSRSPRAAPQAGSCRSAHRVLGGAGHRRELHGTRSPLV